jgi:hypothetical protein
MRWHPFSRRRASRLTYLNSDQIMDLEDYIMDRLDDVLCRKNADGSLDRLLRELDMEDAIAKLFGGPEPLKTWSNGKLLIVGCQEKMEDEIVGVSKGLGIARKRLEFVRYDDATNYNFKKLEYLPTYAAILVGASPHSTKGKGDSRSILSRMQYLEEHREKYPTVVRLTAENLSGQLKITKTNFRSALSELMREGIVAPD